ncbi:hypothetical protein Hanom_Chr04g00283891 [Helianthus anomalus]
MNGTLSLPTLATVSCFRYSESQLLSRYPFYQCSGCTRDRVHAMTCRVDVLARKMSLVQVAASRASIKPDLHSDNNTISKLSNS